jgi:diacylglycerol kinase (ATP)
MKTVHLIHNPTAGDKEHSGKELVSLIEAEGYICKYASTAEDGWKTLDSSADILAVAGGDGTLRKVVMAMLDGGLNNGTAPVAFIPSGTANNLGRSLGLMQEPRELIAAWKSSEVAGFDVGKIEGCGEGMYFLEGFGFGIFPRLMNSIDRIKAGADATAEEKVQGALEVLLDITREYQARDCRIVVDGMTHSGKFLLVEIMNIDAIGPQLNINPAAAPGDGEFEIIIIPEDQRERLQAFVQYRMDGQGENVTFTSLKGKEISICWDGTDGHADDAVLTAEHRFDISIHIHPCVLSLLLPNKAEAD